MSLILRVGDPHFKPDNLKESHKLMQFVQSTALTHKADRIEFAGDLQHTHASVRGEVMEFCTSWFESLTKQFDVWSLEGNHDQFGDKQSEGIFSSIKYLKFVSDRVKIISSPLEADQTLYLPHTSSEDKFKAWIADTAMPYLFCHQTINGSQYENGFYAKDGMDPELFKKFKRVISGHIHKYQEFANILYIGTAKWDSVSDANQDKFIWLFKDGEVLEKIDIPADVCSRIVSYDVYEGQELPAIQPGERAHVTLFGKTPWIIEQGKLLKGIAKITPKPTDTIRPRADPSKLKSIEDYLNCFELGVDITKEDVLEFLRTIK